MLYLVLREFAGTCKIRIVGIVAGDLLFLDGRFQWKKDGRRFVR